MSPSTRNIVAWVLQVLVGLAFIAAGGNKFLNLNSTLSMFDQLGLPTVMAYLVAGGEVLLGICLLIPRFVRFAAPGLIIIMIGAVFMHITKIPGGMANGIPALALLILLGVLLWLRQPRTTLV